MRKPVPKMSVHLEKDCNTKFGHPEIFIRTHTRTLEVTRPDSRELRMSTVQHLLIGVSSQLTDKTPSAAYERHSIPGKEV
jgi:hypothetical protein